MASHRRYSRSPSPRRGRDASGRRGAPEPADGRASSRKRADSLRADDKRGTSRSRRRGSRGRRLSRATPRDSSLRDRSQERSDVARYSLRPELAAAHAMAPPKRRRPRGGVRNRRKMEALARRLEKLTPSDAKPVDDRYKPSADSFAPYALVLPPSASLVSPRLSCAAETGEPASSSVSSSSSTSSIVPLSDRRRSDGPSSSSLASEAVAKLADPHIALTPSSLRAAFPSSVPQAPDLAWLDTQFGPMIGHTASPSSSPPPTPIADVEPDPALCRSFCDRERRVRDECYRLKACRRECDAYFLESGADVAGSDAHMTHICALDRKQQRLEQVSITSPLDDGDENAKDRDYEGDEKCHRSGYRPRSTKYDAHLRRLELRRVSGAMAVAMDECSTARLEFLAVLVRRCSASSSSSSSSSRSAP